MKEFKKTTEGLFICEECGRTFDTRQGIGNHIGRKHDKKEYYDKWFRENNEGICNICGKITHFRDLYFGYKQTCSKICENKLSILNLNESIFKKHGVKSTAHIPGLQNKKRITCVLKYGVEVSSQADIVKQQTKKNNIEKYGVENPYQVEEFIQKAKQTKKEKYGDENYTNREKSKQTTMKNYGCEYGLSNPYIREKGKLTMIKKYGVEYALQNKEIFEKTQKNKFISKLHDKTGLYYRSTYELDFLEKYHDKFPDIKNAPSFKYIFQNKNKIYFPDFFIPSLNLIVEIKSSYIYECQGMDISEAKKKSVIDKGYNYICIINKKYDEFNSKIMLWKKLDFPVSD